MDIKRTMLTFSNGTVNRAYYSHKCIGLPRRIGNFSNTSRYYVYDKYSSMLEYALTRSHSAKPKQISHIETML